MPKLYTNAPAEDDLPRTLVQDGEFGFCPFNKPVRCVDVQTNRLGAQIAKYLGTDTWRMTWDQSQYREAVAQGAITEAVTLPKPAEGTIHWYIHLGQEAMKRWMDEHPDILDEHSDEATRAIWESAKDCFPKFAEGVISVLESEPNLLMYHSTESDDLTPITIIQDNIVDVVEKAVTAQWIAEVDVRLSRQDDEEDEDAE